MKFLLALFFVLPQGAVNRNVVVATPNINGSGVIIKTDYVLTAYHLVGEQAEIRVNYRPAEIVAGDKDIDLALLHTSTDDFGFIKFGHPKRGDAVFYVANSGGHINLLSRGYILYMDFQWTLTDTTSVGGMSGGGLYDKRERLIGLNKGMECQANIGCLFTLHVTLDKIQKFLEKAGMK